MLYVVIIVELIVSLVSLVYINGVCNKVVHHSLFSNPWAQENSWAIMCQPLSNKTGDMQTVQAFNYNNHLTAETQPKLKLTSSVQSLQSSAASHQKSKFTPPYSIILLGLYYLLLGIFFYSNLVWHVEVHLFTHISNRFLSFYITLIGSNCNMKLLVLRQHCLVPGVCVCV